MPTALVFAAGLGTRLKPLTDTMPKAMVPVCGEPLIAHTLRRLKAAGFDRAVVNVHHFGQQIIDFLSENDFGIEVAVSDERDCLLDTGGGLRKAAPLLTAKEPAAPILIHNVDILSNADLPAFLAAAQENDVTLLVSRRDTKRYLLFDADNRLCGWTNIETGSAHALPRPRCLNMQAACFLRAACCVAQNLRADASLSCALSHNGLLLGTMRQTANKGLRTAWPAADRRG